MSSRQNQSSKAVTIKEIAARCGVHHATVSRALRGPSPYVSEALRAQILAVAAEMGYDPSYSHAARHLRAAKKGTPVVSQVVALFLPRDFADIPYFRALFRGLSEELMAQHFSVLLHFADTAEYPLSPIFRRGDVDGLIFSHDTPAMRLLLQELRRERNFGERPVVSVLSDVESVRSVIPDDRQGGYLAASHLLDLGHRHLIHFVIEAGDEYGQIQRFVGLRQAYRERGLDPEAYLHPCEVWDFGTAAVVASCFRDTLARTPHATAVLARNDFWAPTLLDVCAERGLRVPEDISLVGYDDTDDVHQLTTVHVPLTEIGQSAAQMIIQRITGGSADEATIILPTSLVIRRTTAPANGTRR